MLLFDSRYSMTVRSQNQRCPHIMKLWLQLAGDIPGKYYLHLDEMKYLECILLLLDVWHTRHDRHQCDVFTFGGAELLGLVVRRSSRQKKILSKWRLLFVGQFAGHCEQYKTVHSADIKECTMCKRGRCWWAAFWDCDSFSSCCPTFWCIHTWCWLHLVCSD